MRQFKLGLYISIFTIIFTFSFFLLNPAVAQAEEVSAENITQTEETISDDDTPIDSDEETNVSDTAESTEEDETQTEDSNSNPAEGTTSTQQSPSNTTTKPAAPSTQTSNQTTQPSTSKNTNTKKNTKKATVTNLERWLNICETLGDNLKKRHFIYSNSRTKSTYKAALKKRRRSNCALYVSWCLQQYGAIKSGQTFYVRRSGSIHKNFRKWGSKVKVIHVNKKCSSANLEAGDIVCWAGIAHTNIYAGKNNSGDRLWYDAGKASTYSGHTGSRYENVGAKQLSYLNSKRISYIIRIKNL